MIKKAFDIKFRPEIESGKFKVVTVDGRPVTILRWDMKGNYPILACTMVKQCNWEGDKSWDEERPFAYNQKGHAAGAALADKLDLFLIPENPELMEFEYAVQEIFFKDRTDGLEMLKITSATLLKVARRQLAAEFPKWKKSQSFEHNGKLHQLVIRDGKMFASSTKERGDWFLDFSELEKLPKEE